MLRPKLPIDPPKWVPGPFRAPKQPPGIPAQRQPSFRYYMTTGSETLAGLAEMFYGNPREAVRIFNANRLGMLRDDRAMGFLRTPQDALAAGSTLLIP